MGNAIKTFDISRGKPAIDLAETPALEKLSKLLDSAVRVPGTGVSLGLDSVLGLLPVIGDAIGGILSSYIIYEAARLGIPKLVLARMMGNLALDAVLGSIPILGDLFDIGFKANLKNVNLIKEHAPLSARERSPKEISRLVRIAIGLFLVALVSLSAALGYFLLRLIS